MAYHAERTGQITWTDGLGGGKVHEVGDVGRPLCNRPITKRPSTPSTEWRPAVFTERGEGDVTCLLCERIRRTQEERGLRPVLESRLLDLPRLPLRIREMKVGDRIGDEHAWIERAAVDRWIVSTPLYHRATARTAERAAKLYAEEAFG